MKLKHMKPNFIGTRIPIPSQYEIEVWKQELSSYWDQHLLKFLQFGSPLGFNRKCELRHTEKTHKSAVDYPKDMLAYIEEEVEHKAIYGPFKETPIEGGMCLLL